MILSTWVANTLEEINIACGKLLNDNAEEIDIFLEEVDNTGHSRQLRIIVKRIKPQEGDDETAGKSD